MKINVNNRSSVQIENIYFDPYNIKKATHKAKYIFLTHTHYDHLSINDIDKVINSSTIIIATEDAKNTLETRYQNKIYYVKPFDNLSFEDMEVEVLPAYNLNKQFHKKSFGWVGYKIIFNGQTFAILGDTDFIPEHEKLSCDYLFLPIGGTYTMDAKEASNLTNTIKPKFVIPVHYNSIVGSKQDESIFLKNLNKGISAKVYL